MERCIQIPEIIRSICDEANPKDSLSVALASRGFLQQGLDSVWKEINGFEAIIACLPSDVWRMQEVAYDGKLFRNYFLRRPVTSKDMHRYQSYYAPRIRRFGLKLPLDRAVAILSLEAFQGLQLATQWCPGALSPLLKALDWLDPSMVLEGLNGGIFMNQCFPFISLFLAESVTELDVTIRSTIHLQVATAHSAIDRLTNLQRLSLTDVEADVVLDGVSSSLTTTLTHLRISTISVAAVRQLAYLPHLVSLTIQYLSSQANQPSVDRSLLAASFPSLEYLGVLHVAEPDFMHMLSLLPDETNRIKWLHTNLELSSPVLSMQDVINTIGMKMNPHTLSTLSLVVAGVATINAQETLEELDELDPLDISPLIPLRRLVVCLIDTAQTVQLKPEDALRISEQWSDVRHLELCGMYSCRVTPLIDHTHILGMLEGCRHLNHLSIHFDSSRTRASERSGKAPFYLKKLCVGDSPIYSTSRVLAFLKANFDPQHLALTIHENLLPSTTFKRRWKQVAQEWKSSGLGAA